MHRHVRSLQVQICIAWSWNPQNCLLCLIDAPPTRTICPDYFSVLLELLVIFIIAVKRSISIVPLKDDHTMHFLSRMSRIGVFGQISEITDHLFLSGAGCLKPEKIRQKRIVFVVNATTEEPNTYIQGAWRHFRGTVVRVSCASGLCNNSALGCTWTCWRSVCTQPSIPGIFRFPDYWFLVAIIMDIAIILIFWYFRVI